MVSERIERFIQTLPDPQGAKIFLERLQEEAPKQAALCTKNEELCANLLLLASYSPLLAESCLQHPDYINWLERERDIAKMKSKEELVEELARFSAVNSTLSDSVVLARFKRRELLRIYLRDCKKLATMSETTEELSILADAMLERTLQKAYQPLLQRYGQPTTQEQGRLTNAEMAIVALGKLGSRELNYSSDIDLVFIYSGDGETTGKSTGAVESTTNKLFFTKLAEALVKTIGSPFGEGIIFRIDLRLRPRGREGDLASSLKEMIRYYRSEAQGWERQALIRARAAAGNAQIVEKFLSSVEDLIFLPRPVSEALRDIRMAKEKINTQVANRSALRDLRLHDQLDQPRSTIAGYNVKLGRGGIREIEFIAQALQICYGGQDRWLRNPQIVISLQRLAEKGLLSEQERSRLASAYNFLRLCEHRLQMEHGLQTHSLPLSDDRLELLARRCSYSSHQEFEHTLKTHAENVSKIYRRVFESSTEGLPRPARPHALRDSAHAEPHPLKGLLAEVIDGYLHFGSYEEADLRDALSAGLQNSYSPSRALKKNKDLIFSLGEGQHTISLKTIEQFTRLAGCSHYFGEMIVSHTHLLSVLEQTPSLETATANLAEPLEGGYESLLKQLRVLWHRAILEIGCYDVLAERAHTPQEHLTRVSAALTELADRSVARACEIALARTCGMLQIDPAATRFTVLGLGRLGHRDLDYDSDLDLLLVYSEGHLSAQFTAGEVYAHLCETLVQVLSSLLRDGALYRVDLRLRPEGKAGTLSPSLERLAHYLSGSAAVWELMAYLKARPIAGDMKFGEEVERAVLEAIFKRSAGADFAVEVDAMRQRLEREKSESMDIKFGRGGLLDIYFVSRYLQLLHQLPDPPARDTLSLLESLRRADYLTDRQHGVLSAGYTLLASIDHQLRLQAQRPSSRIPVNPNQLKEIALSLGFSDTTEFQHAFSSTTDHVRTVYNEVLKKGGVD